MTRHASLFTILATLALGCGDVVSIAASDRETTASTHDAIVGGTTDGNDRGVVALYAETHDGGALCTATVIAPTVLLTAAHCVCPDELGQDARFHMYAGSDATAAAAVEWTSIAEVHWDQAFDAKHPQHGHDIGVAILSAPTRVKPVPVNVDAIPGSAKGTSIRVVGFGESQAKSHDGAGIRRQTKLRLVDFDDTILELDSNSGDTCEGDSGGPAIMRIGGVEKVVGITSFGRDGCDGPAFETRLDAYAEFLSDYL
jgi:secreted trypsin-like serine protease